MNQIGYLTLGFGCKLVGETYNAKTCFESTDIFFDCLDDQQSINVNPQICTNEHNTWSKVCDASIRREQLMTRRQNKQDHQLYTQQQLDAHNRIKNKPIQLERESYLI